MTQAISRFEWIPEHAQVHQDRQGAIVAVQGSPVLISAPHEADHVRDGTRKYPEPGTGELAMRLASETGSSAICSVGHLEGDPNWDAAHPYLNMLLDLRPALVIDVHQMRPRGFDVCLGTGEFKTLSIDVWPGIAVDLVRADFSVSVNFPFSAGPRTVTSRVQSLGIQAVQIEFSSDLFYERQFAMPTIRAILSKTILSREKWNS